MAASRAQTSGRNWTVACRHATAGRATALAAALALGPGPLAASTLLQRCMSANDTRVYTDRACAAFGAAALPLPAALLARIAQDAAREARVHPQDIRWEPATLLREPAPARRPAAAGCAHSPHQLEADLRGSFALGDVNRLAESYHWVGLSTRAGRQTLDRLQRLLRAPLLDSHYFQAQVAAAPVDAATPLDAPAVEDGSMLQLVVAARDGRTATDFRVRRFAGCYFIEFPSPAGYAL